MNELVEAADLSELLGEAGIDYKDMNFEELYDKISVSEKHIGLVDSIKTKIRGYFSGMEITEGATIYDKLVLSLRKKDLIATFNWDPLLLQAYRRCGKYTHESPRLAFLHGNVGVGICEKDKTTGVLGNMCSKCLGTFEPVELLYPIKNKNYNQTLLLRDEWKMLKSHLKHAYFITIFGYRAPTSDVNARSIMKKAWNKNTTKPFSQIEIIARPGVSEESVYQSWDDFIISHHYEVVNDFHESYIARHPRRTCDAFAMQSLQCDPWHDNPIPRKTSLTDLLKWLEPLLKEEKADKGFSGLRC